MISITEAEEIARDFAIAKGEVASGVYLGIDTPKEYSTCYYFDFTIVNKDGKWPEDLPAVGGAPGLIVDKEHGTAEVISWERLRNLY